MPKKKKGKKAAASSGAGDATQSLPQKPTLPDKKGKKRGATKVAPSSPKKQIKIESKNKDGGKSPAVPPKLPPKKGKKTKTKEKPSLPAKKGKLAEPTELPTDLLTWVADESLSEEEKLAAEKDRVEKIQYLIETKSKEVLVAEVRWQDASSSAGDIAEIMEEEAKFQDKLAQLNIDAENFEDPSIKFRAEVNGKSVAEMEALLSSLPYDGSLSAARAKNDLIAIQRIELFQYGQEEVDKAWRKKKRKKKEKLLHCLATEAKEKRKQLLASHTADAPQRRKNAEAAVKAKGVLQKVNQEMEILASALRRHLNAVSALERVISAHAKAANDIAEARTKIAEMEKKMKEAHIRAEEAEKSAKEAHAEKEKAHAEKEKAHAEKREAHAERERHEVERARALAEKEKAEKALADALVKAAFHEQHHISWKEKAHKWASGAQMVSAAATPLRTVGEPSEVASDKLDEGEEACDRCSAVMRPGLKFCTSCGTQRGGGDNRSNSGDSKASEPSAAETTEVECQQCHERLPAGTKFCIHCGGNIKAPDPPEEQKCSNCDDMIRPGLRFCTSCGTKVSSKRKESAADKRNEGGKTDGGGGPGDDGSGDSGELSKDDTEGMCLDDLLSTMDEHIEESGGAKKGASLVDHMKAVKADKTKANIMDTTEHEL